MKTIAGSLAVAVLAIAMFACSFSLHLDTRQGRKGAADLIVSLIETQIPGRMSIGEILSIEDGLWVARDLVFRSEQGREVLRLDHIEYRPDWGAVWNERVIGCRAAFVRGGRVELAQGDDGLYLERAFDDGRPSPGGQAPSFFIHFDRVRFEQLTTDWSLGAAPEFQIARVSGFMDFRTDQQGNVMMRFDRLRGVAKVHSPSLQMEVVEAAGRIHAKHREMVTFDLLFREESRPLGVHLEIASLGNELRARVEIDPDAPIAWLTTASLASLDDVFGFPGEIVMRDHLALRQLSSHERPD